VNKKERERLEQEDTERESKARSESEDRKARIKILWQDFTQTTPGRVKKLAKGELGKILVELVELEKCEIEYLTQFHRQWERIHAYYRDELEKLSRASLHAEHAELWPVLWPEIKKWAEQRPPKNVYEAKRRRYNWSDVGEIEQQFGGPERFNSFLGKVVSPTGDCLDSIFAGNGVNMWRLQELFGIHRNRFPSKLPSPKKEHERKGRERLYDYCEVVEIMDALLGEKPTERKRPARGRPLRLWLSDPDLRTRVLTGIGGRLNEISVPKDIKAAFVAVMHHHLPDSAK
jgi:hypothetical protein